MSTENKNKKKRKRSDGIKRTLDFPSAAESLTAAAGLLNSAAIASNAMSTDLFVKPPSLSSGLLIRYAENDAAAAQRSNSARTASSSTSELNAIQGGPASYKKYMDKKKNTKGTNTYAVFDEQGNVRMGGRKTRRKKRRRKKKLAKKEDIISNLKTQTRKNMMHLVRIL